MTSRATQGAQAREALARALLELAEQGQRPRCSDAPQLWVSDDVADRREVIRYCHTCPLQTPCAAVGEHERHGVWGGADRSLTNKAVAS